MLFSCSTPSLIATFTVRQKDICTDQVILCLLKWFNTLYSVPCFHFNFQKKNTMNTPIVEKKHPLLQYLPLIWSSAAFLLEDVLSLPDQMITSLI